MQMCHEVIKYFAQQFWKWYKMLKISSLLAYITVAGVKNEFFPAYIIVFKPLRIVVDLPNP